MSGKTRVSHRRNRNHQALIEALEPRRLLSSAVFLGDLNASGSSIDLTTLGTARLGVNDTFYFAANDGVHGKELWKSDGTADGTVMVKARRGTAFREAYRAAGSGWSL